MQELDVSTEIHAPATEVYEFLLDFPGYATYSTHLRSVERYGEGGPGTEYALVLGWWKVTYTVRSKVTAVTPPERIEFELIRGIHAKGEWRIEPIDEESCRVRLIGQYRPDSVERDAVSLPSFTSLDWVIERVENRVYTEIERIVERVVADLEGAHRDVELVVHT